MPQFRIPKQTDRSLIQALNSICQEMASLREFTIEIVAHENGGPTYTLPRTNPEDAIEIQYILAEESATILCFRLRDQDQYALIINRKFNEITDTAIVGGENGSWINQLPNNKSQIYVKLVALARKHLKVTESEAALGGAGEGGWARYKDSQVAILSSLAETQKTISSEFARKVIEAEVAAKNKYDNLESELKHRHEKIVEKLAEEHAVRINEVVARENVLKAKEESFETKEARYVARQEQQKQIDKIQGWLEGWSLTKGTQNKRTPIFWVCVLVSLFMGFLVIHFSGQTVEILQSKDLKTVEWWQWMLLSLKSLFPLAVLVSFLIYYIRWSSAWARQHAEEEFRNRARILDIGRTAWLIEAVRDAQDNDKELPLELVKELSRNLFSYAPFSDSSDPHPQSITDFVAQGLNSLRIKAPDGTEVEAKGTKHRR